MIRTFFHGLLELIDLCDAKICDTDVLYDKEKMKKVRKAIKKHKSYGPIIVKF